MTIVTISKAQSGYELTKGTLEAYLWTIASTLDATNDVILLHLADEIRKEFKRFEGEISNILEETWAAFNASTTD